MKKLNNFRDLNGISNKIKEKLIFRSGNPDSLKSRDINNIGIKTIIDLRTYRERKKSKKFLGINTVNLPINYDLRIIEKVKKIIFKKNEYDNILEIIKDEYINFVEFEKNTINKVFSILSNKNNYPVLIHCRAGKDRTGFVAAVILKAIEINDKEILKDYLISNELFLIKAKKILRLFKIFTFNLLNMKNIESLLTSHPENIQAVLNEIHIKYDNINNYLASCNINLAVIEKFKKIILN